MKSNSNNKAKKVKSQIHLSSIKDCRRLLSRTANQLLSGQIGDSKSKAIGYLCSIFIRTFEIENQENQNNNIAMTPEQMASIFTSQINSIPMIDKHGNRIK